METDLTTNEHLPDKFRELQDLILGSGNGSTAEQGAVVVEHPHKEQIAEALTSIQAEMQSMKGQILQHEMEIQRFKEELNDFAYVISHDLKAPLRGISGLSEILIEDLAGQLDAEDTETLNLIQKRAQRMQNMVDGLLHYSRIGRFETDKRKIDIGLLLKELLLELDPEDLFEKIVSEDLPEIYFNPVRLRELFRNLIDNAIQHHEGPYRKIAIHCEDRPDDYLVVVTDNGPGIDQRHHDRVFGIFYTLTSKDVKASTGMGLAVVKKIIEDAGGNIRIDSAPGKGLKFQFTIPHVEEENALP